MSADCVVADARLGETLGPMEGKKELGWAEVDSLNGNSFWAVAIQSVANEQFRDQLRAVFGGPFEPKQVREPLNKSVSTRLRDDL